MNEPTAGPTPRTIFSEPVTTPVLPAATVVVLRDGEQGLEVLMLRRHVKSDVLGGAFVFPGGKLDAADRVVAGSRCVDAPPQRLHARLGEPQLDAREAAALFVAACRETLEESGVLFAHGADAGHARRARENALHAQAFDAVLDALSLRLDTEALVPWTRWITPRVPAMMSRRFDARFFVAQLPAGQQARHDDHEATESVWLRPRAAIERYRRREIVLAPVQLMSLVHLARHDSAASVLDEARTRMPPLIEPEPFEESGVRAIAYPGHPRHPVRERAIPGPDCLLLRDELFEPAAGFDSLLGVDTARAEPR
ncbi:MAG: NUDIX hydrolase [Burkholderiaceae bacterium]|nr:NUDIX hydrolase [Burkholderiaceae bacterium]